LLKSIAATEGAEVFELAATAPFLSLVCEAEPDLSDEAHATTISDTKATAIVFIIYLLFIGLFIIHYTIFVNCRHSGEGRNPVRKQIPERETKTKSLLNKPAGFRPSPE
jgi:hypothetical protein